MQLVPGTWERTHHNVVQIVWHGQEPQVRAVGRRQAAGFAPLEFLVERDRMEQRRRLPQVSLVLVVKLFQELVLLLNEDLRQRLRTLGAGVDF